MSTLSPVPTVVRSRRVAGFTLVEMLVSVAIVLLMMSMFAQIFQMATGSLSQQRGIAENDQKARMLTTTVRGDLELRTFRDVFPFRAGEDTRQLGHSLARRAGYFEIDENDPFDDTDDVLSFTASVNIKLQNKDGSPFTGRATALSARAITNLTANSIDIAGSYASVIPANLRVWIVGSLGPNGETNNGRYTVTSSTGTTTINFPANSFNTAAYHPTLPSDPDRGWGYICLSESEPEFDDGLFGNDTAVSSAAEVCYFLRSGVLYRRVLLIREPASGADAQPTWTTGAPQLWNSSTLNENYPTSGTATTFWRDFDYSAFYFSGKMSSTGTQAPGVRFHNAAESLSNSSQAPLRLTNDTITLTPTSFPVSLGIPHLRFGHSTSSGLPQDASTIAVLPGPDNDYSTAGDNVQVRIGRFNLQECSNSAFGYPGIIPAGGNPFGRTDLQINPNTGLVIQYSDAPTAPYLNAAVPLFPGQTSRRGEDILMSNVLSFDVKVWDPIYNSFVDLGDDTDAPNGPFSSTARGRLNTAYAPGPNHFRFDTWHPLASISGNGEPPIVPFNRGVDGLPGVAGTDDDGNSTIDDLSELGWSGSDDRPESLSAIQITINYRDISSSQVRQVTIVQSLVDRVKLTPVTNEAPEE